MRILCLPEGNSIAHVSRVLEIAKVLRARGHECHFAGFGECLDVVGADGFPCHSLPGMTITRIAEALRRTDFRMLFGDEAELNEFVEAELALYRRLRPDLVLVDDRRTATLSTRIAGLPHVGVVNAHASNYSARPMLMPFFDRDGGRSVFARAYYLAQVAVEQRIYDRGLVGFRRLCKRRGLPAPFAYDIVRGRDLTLVPDDPDFTPVHRPPATFRFVGPLTWKNRQAQIENFESFAAYPRRLFVVLGSGGFEEILAQLPTLRDERTAYCVAAGSLSAKVSADELPPNVRVVRYVNADRLIPHCHAAICHGGNGTVYQMLQHGVPMIAVPTHNEQDYNARRVQQLGVGRRFSGRRLREHFGEVVSAARALADDPLIRTRAQEWKTKLARHDGPTRATELIEGVLLARREEHR